MAAGERELMAYLDGLGIETTTIRHPALFTVADSRTLRGDIAGGHTKNLFLKDKKDNYFLLTVEESAVVDLKSIHREIGAASRLSFGSAEAMQHLLGVSPGAVTLFGLLNDTGQRIRFFMDEALLVETTVNAHPLTNEATTSILTADVLKFAEATGHVVTPLKV